MPTATTIKRINAYEVVVPGKPGAINTAAWERPGDRWDLMPITLLEITLDDGIIALGEVERGHALASVEPWLRQLPGLPVHGWSLQTLPASWRGGARWGLLQEHPPELWQSPSPVTRAVEVALLDWAGKQLGCRVVDLLGGQVQDRIAVDWWCSRQTPDDLTRIVRQARSQGFRGLKMKSKIGDPVVKQVQAIKAAGGDDFHITIDPMCQWLSPAYALAVIRQLEPYANNLQIEDPFPQDMPELWQRVRNVSSIPLVLHARGVAVLQRGLQDCYADNYNVSGQTISEFLTLARTVEVAGYSCWHGSSLELGVMQSARLHATAAARACVLPSDFQSQLIREHTLVTWNWPYADGQLQLPDGPGLGIQLDRDALQRYVQATAMFE